MPICPNGSCAEGEHQQQKLHGTPLWPQISPPNLPQGDWRWTAVAALYCPPSPPFKDLFTQTARGKIHMLGNAVIMWIPNFRLRLTRLGVLEPNCDGTKLTGDSIQRHENIPAMFVPLSSCDV